MSLQKLWFGTLADGRTFMALGSDPERALNQGMLRHLKMKLRDRQTEMEWGRVKFTEAEFVLKDDEVKACHCDDLPFGWRPVDPLWWLIDQDVATLKPLVAMLNDGNIGEHGAKMAAMYQRLQMVHRKPMSAFKTERSRQYYAWEMALMLRLSMVVDVARQVPRKKYSGDRAFKKLDKIVAMKRKERIEEFIGTHAPNIGKKLAEECARFPGVDWGRVRADEEEVVRKFCKAYGYNLDEMEFSDALALFRGGPVELERSVTRHQLGFIDHVQYYRINEWQKRAKFQKYLRTLKGPRRPKNLKL